MNTIAARKQFTKANDVLRRGRWTFQRETYPPTGTINQIYCHKCVKKARKLGLYADCVSYKDIQRSLIYAWNRIEYHGSPMLPKPPHAEYCRFIIRRGLQWWFAGGDRHALSCLEGWAKENRA